MVSQEKLDDVYLNIASKIATLSRATRAKVGAIIVKNYQIIAEGFNGTPSGLNNSCEYIDTNHIKYTKPEVIHAEMNCILKLGSSTQSARGATLYTTYGPCIECAKSIIQVGIIRVCYLYDYHSKAGTDLLIIAGLNVEKFSNNFNDNSNYAEATIY